jgi:cytosine/adenosine deaminase-related metal-dependent hydrolase
MRILINARNRSIAVENGCVVESRGHFDVIIDRPGADVLPGLVNSHDHLHRNHYGRLGRPTYPNAYRWADDIQRRHRRRIARLRRVPRRDALLAGAWKNLFAGVTTVVHHDRWEPDFDRDFPIRVARIACADSIGRTPDVEGPATSAFCIHVAEGVDDIAASEVPALDHRGLLNSNLVAVHGVGIDRCGIAQFRRAGAALVWCPTSNHFLFGRSAPEALLDGGTDVLLGSDSRLTAAGDLLDELAAARSSCLVDDERLADSVGRTATRRLGLPAPSLEPGSRADLILLDRPLMEARAKDVALTVVAGIPRVARTELARHFGPLAERGTKLRLGSLVRWTNASSSTDRRNVQ